MTLGGRCYGASVLEHLGVQHAFAESDMRYPEVDDDSIAAAHVDVVVAPSEPYPFGERHRVALERIAPVVFVDGQDLFWWGVRTPSAVARLADALVHVGRDGSSLRSRARVEPRSRRMPELTYRINDADNHFNEPPDCFERYIDPGKVDLAIRHVVAPDGSEIQLFAGRPSKFTSTATKQVTFSTRSSTRCSATRPTSGWGA